MLQSISWSDYFNFLWIALLFYYTVVVLLFYQKELAILIKRRNVVSNDLPGIPFPEENDDKLLQELRELHRATTRRDFPKEELMLTLTRKLKQYSVINKGLVKQFIEEAFPQFEEQDRRRIWQKWVTGIVLLVYSVWVHAQDGNAGINEANAKVRSYFASGTNLMYAVGAILGLIGAVKVYQKWNSGDPDTGKVAAAWFGSCVFLVVVATVIRSFFGV